MTSAADYWYVIRNPSGCYFRGLTDSGWQWTGDLTRAHRCYSDKPLEQLRPENFVPEAVREHFPPDCTMLRVECQLRAEGDAGPPDGDEDVTNPRKLRVNVEELTQRQDGQT